MHKILVARGKVSFTPCEENPVDVAEDDKSVENSDTKDVSQTDTKKPIRQKKSK